jgi:hypothetical protein
LLPVRTQRVLIGEIESLARLGEKNLFVHFGEKDDFVSDESDGAIEDFALDGRGSGRRRERWTLWSGRRLRRIPRSGPGSRAPFLGRGSESKSA